MGCRPPPIFFFLPHEGAAATRHLLPHRMRDARCIVKFFDLWVIANRIELGLNPIGTDELTEKIIAEKNPFSHIKEDVSKLKYQMVI